MRFVMLDLMPLLWGMCTAAALLLLFHREWGAPARVIPGAALALVLYFLKWPPRIQVLAFAVMYGCCALAWFIVVRTARIRQRIRQRQTSNKESRTAP